MKQARNRVAMLVAIGLATWHMAAAAATNTCNLAKIAEWPVRWERGAIVADGTINGHKVGIVLDTGASRSMVFRSAAEKLGLPLQALRGPRLFGIGGETNVESVRIDEFRIVDAVRKDWIVIAAGEREAPGNSAFILGEDFFSKADVEFDLAHNAVRLFIPKDCGSTPLAYWVAEGANQIEIDKSALANSAIVVPVVINDKPVEAWLDSGASTSILDKGEAARLGVTPETPGVIAVGRWGGLGANTVPYWRGPFASFAIGNEVIKDTTIEFADLWKDANTSRTHVPTRLSVPGMLLGADFFRSHRILVSHSQHRMYFTYVGGPVFSLERRARAAPDMPADGAGAPANDAK